MYEIEGLHLSLSEAREELQKRWNNVELRKKIEEELGENFWSEFKDKPRGVYQRCLVSPDNGFAFFYQMAKYINAEPLAIEFLDDKFVSLNPEKKYLGRPHYFFGTDEVGTVDIINFSEIEPLSKRLKMREVKTRTGENLADFHHKLFEIWGNKLEIKDKSSWFNFYGNPSEFYYPCFLHFVAHGIWFENIEADEDDEKGVNFLKNIVALAIEKIEKKYGLRPLVVRIYPKNQTDEEDLYWWCYPKDANEYLIKYGKDNDLKFKKY